MEIDLNADLGETFGIWGLGEDDALIPICSSVNMACGFHAGDPITIEPLMTPPARPLGESASRRRPRSSPADLDPGRRTKPYPWPDGRYPVHHDRALMPKEGAMSAVPITLAVAHYDRHVPFIEGSVAADGVELRTIEVAQTVPGRYGTSRHRRMLRDGEFDAAEISFSSYLMAVDRGLPFTAIPIVPRRLFSQSLIYTRIDSPLTGPKDLAGKRVGIMTYQTTLSVLAKGDLEHAHGVPWKSIRWVLNHDEIIPFEPPTDVRIERGDPSGKRRIHDLLLDGEIDALLMPHPPKWLTTGEPRIRRVFPDAKRAELDYYRRFGYWPIMHFVAIRNDVVERHPWLPRSLYDAYFTAKERLAQYYSDPNWTSMAWATHYQEEERRLFGDPWQHGLAANRTNVEQFMRYSHEQGLISAPMTPERLFHESVLDT